MSDSLLSHILNHRSFTSMTDFADRIGVARATIYRWKTALPDPDTLSKVAITLGDPYPVVLRAALRGSGYLTTDGEIAAGLPIDVILHGATRYEPWGQPIAAYTSPADSDTYMRVAEDAYPGSYEKARVIIDTAPVPVAAQQFHASMHRIESAGRPIDCHSTYLSPLYFPDLDDNLLAEHGGLDIYVKFSRGYFFQLMASGFDEDIVRIAAERVRDRLSDRLPPAGIAFATAEFRKLPTRTESLPDFIVTDDGEFGQIAVAAILAPEEIHTAATAYKRAQTINASALADIMQREAL